MDESLPEEVDVIIIGTGLPESVLSGALSRISQSVLHLDPEQYYGSSWASFNINCFDELMKNNSLCQEKPDIDVTKLLEETESFLSIQPRTRLAQCESRCFLSKVVREPLAEDTNPVSTGIDRTPEDLESKKADSNSGDDVDNQIKDNKSPDIPDAVQPTNSEGNDDPEKTVSEDSTDDKTSTVEREPSTFEASNNTPQKPSLSPYDELYDRWRQFNIDLTCKVLFSRGLLVEMLIQSNVSRYLEFRSVSRLLTLMKDSLQPVPCTRADVFKSKLVSVVQKRFLMRILTMCANADQHPKIAEEFQDKLFVDFLIANNLCDEAQHFVVHSIAMVSRDAPVMDGVRATHTFLKSLGRFGNSAFLFPSYGVGEVPQAFSRLSAVFGGVFCLRRYAAGLIVDRQTGQCKGIVDSTGQIIRCRYVVLDETNVPDCAKKNFATGISRAVYITDRSLMPSSTEHVTLISLPPNEKHGPIRLVEAGFVTSVCPKDHFVVHAAAEPSVAGSAQPRSVFSSMEDVLFTQPDKSANDVAGTTDDDEKANDVIKPKLLWRAYFEVGEDGVERDQLPSNVFVTSGPGSQLGFDSAMNEARNIFRVICPDEEFLPRAPEPDEIIFNDEGYNTEKNENSSEDRDDIGGDYGEEEEEEEERQSNEEASRNDDQTPENDNRNS